MMRVASRGRLPVLRSSLPYAINSLNQRVVSNKYSRFDRLYGQNLGTPICWSCAHSALRRHSFARRLTTATDLNGAPIVLAELRQRLAEFAKGQPLGILDAKVEEAISEIRRYALQGYHMHPQSIVKIARHYLIPLGYSERPEDAVALLTALGVHNDVDNIHLARFQSVLGSDCRQFPSDVHEEAQVIFNAWKDRMANGHTNGITEDLLHRFRHRFVASVHGPLIAIDDSDAVEIDDAISVEGTDTVYIHIADPSRWAMAGSSIDMCARQRGTSIYLPEETIPMLPPTISVAMASLCSKNRTDDVHAMTFVARLSSYGEIKSIEIIPSLLSNITNITYSEADEMLKGRHLSGYPKAVSSSLATMRDMAESRLTYRKHRGALIFNLPQSKFLKLGANDQQEKQSNDGYNVQALDSLSIARALVAEMMILGGEIAAKFAFQYQIPIPYRIHSSATSFPPSPKMTTQSESRYSESSRDLVLGLPVSDKIDKDNFLLSQYNSMREAMEVGRLGKASMSLTAQPHASLGLDAYTYVTSPLRRYDDMLVHHQFKAYLSGKSTEESTLPKVMSEAQVGSIMREVNESKRLRQTLQSDSERHWMAQYFNQRRGETFDALVIDHPTPEFRQRHHSGFGAGGGFGVDEGNGVSVWVLVPTLGVKSRAFVSHSRVKFGDRIKIRVRDVDIHSGNFRFSAI